jgi:hypothetical protein
VKAGLVSHQKVYSCVHDVKVEGVSGANGAAGSVPAPTTEEESSANNVLVRTKQLGCILPNFLLDDGPAIAKCR